MGTNAKQAIQILIIILGFVTLGAWVATVGDPLVVGALRYGAPAAALFAGWVLFAAPRRQGKEPDHLGQMAAKYFERDGLCLAPVFAEVDGTCVLSVYFQNRYAGRAVARFAMLPPRRSFWFGRHKLPSVTVDLECPGGAFGVVRLPFAVPANYQGRRVKFELGADVAYPDRKGKTLRYREGKYLVPMRQLDRESDAMAGLALGGLGILIALSASSRSRATLLLPNGVAETGPATFTRRVEILALPNAGAASPAGPQRLAA